MVLLRIHWLFRSENKPIKTSAETVQHQHLEVKKMTTSELNQISCTTTWTRQFLRILKLRIDHGDMDRLDRMHSEIFMSNIQKITESVRDIESDNDIMYTKDMVRDLNKYPENEEKKVVKCIMDMLDGMERSLVFYQKDKFKSLKEILLSMLDIKQEDKLL